MFKKVILSAVLALGAFATASNAASCRMGDTCAVTGIDGQALSSHVSFDVNDIVNGGDGQFVFSANFLNDTPGNALGAATVLQFSPSTLGNIGDLTLDITGPAAIAPQTIVLTDAVGAPAFALTGFDLIFVLDLTGTEGSLIDFTLTGNAIPGVAGATPDLNLRISSVPLPAGVLLLGTALAGFGVARRRRKAA